MFLQPDMMNELRTIISSSSNSNSNTMTSLSSQQGGTATKNIEIIFDQYFYNQNNSGPMASIFFQCLMHCFGLSAMKALHEIWKDFDHSSSGK
jgi:hypothetical protein